MNEHEATEIAYNNGYKQGKADGAREIFEEIEKMLDPFGRYIKILRLAEFAELKKKYESEKDE